MVIHAWLMLSVFLFSTEHWVGGSVSLIAAILVILPDALDASPEARLRRLLNR